MPTEEIVEGILLEGNTQVVRAFYPLLQAGVRMQTEKGSSIQTLLCDSLGISADYVEQRIQTIFLNGKPVDKPASTGLEEESRIGLSAAMPGLAGAVLRRSGFFAQMRSQISHHPEDAAGTRDSCFVLVRLFNLLIPELAPKLLAAGIWISRDELKDLLERCGEDLAKGCRKVSFNGREATIEELRSAEWLAEPEPVRVTVRGAE